MGWFDKHKPASDGTKTAEEQSEAQMNALVEKFSAAVDERVKPLRETVEKIQTDWEAVKAEATKPPTVDTRPRNADGTPRELTQEEKNDLGTKAAFAQSVLTNARLTESEVIGELPREWSHLVPEIRAMLAGATFEQKAKADYGQLCRNCADIVIAREARKAGLRYNQDSKSFFLEDKSTSSTAEGPLSDPSLTWRQEKGNGQVKVWSAEEQLRVLGIDPKEFAESMKGVV